MKICYMNILMQLMQKSLLFYHYLFLLLFCYLFMNKDKERLHFFFILTFQINVICLSQEILEDTAGGNIIRTEEEGIKGISRKIRGLQLVLLGLKNREQVKKSYFSLLFLFKMQDVQMQFCFLPPW